MSAVDILGWLTIALIGGVCALIFLVFLLATVDEFQDAGHWPERVEPGHE